MQIVIFLAFRYIDGINWSTEAIDLHLDVDENIVSMYKRFEY